MLYFIEGSLSLPLSQKLQVLISLLQKHQQRRVVNGLNDRLAPDNVGFLLGMVFSLTVNQIEQRVKMLEV